MNILSGLAIPDEGWVKRQGKICPPGGFLRYSSGGTAPELIKLLAPLYRFDEKQVIEYVAAALPYDWLLRTPLKLIPAIIRRELNIALTLAIPCDYYFFLRTPEGGRPSFRKICREALAQRARESAMVLGTSNIGAAKSLGSDASAAILYHGNFTLYRRLDDALAVFERLQPEPALPSEAQGDDDEEPEEDVDVMI